MKKQIKVAAGAIVAALLAGCVTTESMPNGSTKVHLGLGGLIKPAAEGASAPPSAVPAQGGAATPPVHAQAVTTPPPVAAPSIRTTALAGLFTKHPYDGTPKSYFPRVAVTVTDWSRSDCWQAVATVWSSRIQSQRVPAFSVCWGKSMGFAVNNAANLHLFMEQMAIEHSGNVRTSGPKPPMLAVPDRQPIGERQQLDFQGFIEQLVVDTGWQPGAPTNFWLVGYDAKAGAVAAAPATPAPVSTPPTPTAGTGQPMNSRARQVLEQALSCIALGKSFVQAESALKLAGWRPDQGVALVSLNQPIQVYGLSTQKVAVSNDGGEQTYRSYLPGITQAQLVKAAKLKLGKDGKSYGRATKLGVLTADTDNGETTLTCTVDTEGGED